MRLSFFKSKVVKGMMIANLVIASSAFAESITDRLSRPLDYLFKNGLNLRTNWIQGSSDSFGGILSPIKESFQLSIEGSQASSAMIGKSFTSLGSSDTLNTSNPLGGGTKMEEAIKEAHDNTAPVQVKNETSNKRQKIRKKFRED